MCLGSCVLNESAQEAEGMFMSGCQRQGIRGEVLSIIALFGMLYGAVGRRQQGQSISRS